MADLKRKSVRGGMVTMTSQGVSIVIQLALRVPCPSPVASRMNHWTCHKKPRIATCRREMLQRATRGLNALKKTNNFNLVSRQVAGHALFFGATKP